MAYVQQSAVHDKHKAAINRMMTDEAAETESEEESKSANPNEKLYERPQDIMKASILNSTLGLNVQLLKHHVWLGSVLGTYPPTIIRDSSGKITSRGTPPGDPNGSKIAFVYQGSNVEDGPNNCAWLFAWHAPGHVTFQPKIYVEAGDVRKYSDDHFKWDDVESNLDASSSRSYYMDDDTGAEASAQIGKKGNITKASVVLDVQTQSTTSLEIN